MAKKKIRLNRRKFIASGLAGAAGALTFPLCKQQDKPSSEPEKKSGHPFVYRTLGRTGIKLPIISMGTVDATTEALVRKALDEGIAHIVTAQYYLNGRVEEFVGKIIKDYKREDIILATGVVPQPIDYQEGLFKENTNTAKFESDLEGSLKRMAVDYVDILYLPFAAKKESVNFEPLMRTMEKIKKAGKARVLGIGTHSHVPEAVRAAADSGFYDVAMLAYNFQIKDIEERTQAVNYAASKGMGIVAMKTIIGESWMSKTKQQVSNPKAALKWVLQNENIHTTVPGITTFEQLETNLSVMEDLMLTPKEKEYLKLSRVNCKDGLFCQQCGSCLKQCKIAPDVPTLMRGYMYAYAYKSLGAAARTLESIQDDSIACTKCSSCVVNCPMGFDIKEKVLDIIRLKDVPADFLC